MKCGGNIRRNLQPYTRKHTLDRVIELMMRSTDSVEVRLIARQPSPE